MQEAISDFDKALSKKSQLPNGLVKQIERERRNASVPPSWLWQMISLCQQDPISPTMSFGKLDN